MADKDRQGWWSRTVLGPIEGQDPPVSVEDIEEQATGDQGSVRHG